MNIVADIMGTMGLDLAQYDDAINRAINEADSFKQHFDDTGKSVEKSGSEISAGAGEAAEGMEAVGVAAAAMGAAVVAAAGIAAAAIYSLSENVKTLLEEVVGRGDQFHDLAANIGVSTEDLSRFSFVADQSGASLDEVGQSFKFLAKNVYDANNGNQDAIATFNKFGIAFQDASGHARPLADVMLDVSDALHQAAPGAERTGAAMDLLSARSTGMVATLSKGSQELREQFSLSDQLGYTVSTESAARADHFHDLVSQIEAAWTGLKKVMGEEIEVELVKDLEDFVKWIESHHTQLEAMARMIGHAIAEAAEFAMAALKELSDLMETKFGRALVGAAIGYETLGVTGAVTGAYAGFTSPDPSPSVANINVQPIDYSASMGQITSAVQQGLRQQYAQSREDQDRAARRFNIEGGL